jgi:hypothetical protein
VPNIKIRDGWKLYIAAGGLTASKILTARPPAAIYSFHPYLISTFGTYLNRIMNNCLILAF